MAALIGHTGRRWLGLSLLVLLAHGWLLQSLNVDLVTTASANRPAQDLPLMFETRTIAAPTPVLPVRPATASKRPLAARPKPTPAPAAATPMSATPESIAAAAAAPSDPDSTTAGPPPGAAAGDQASADAAPSAVATGNGEDSAAEPGDAPATDQPPVRPPARERALRVDANRLSGSTRMTYVVNTSKFPYVLDGELLWHNNGTTYNARLRYSAFGRARVQTSRGRIDEAGLAPERFSDKYRSEVAAHFNYPAGKVTFSANTPDAALLAGAQDRLSVLLQIGLLLASEPERFAPGVTMTLPTVGGRDADLWMFTVIDTETLQLPGGEVQGIKLERLPREPYDQKVELWMAPQLGYLPVRIRITESNGERIDQQWQASEAPTAASADGQ